MDSPSTSITNKYSNIELIGSGTFGQVYIATHNSSGNKVVIKRVPKNSNAFRVENEIKANIALTGIPNIAQYYETFESNNSYWMIFEHIEGGDLFYHLQSARCKPFPEKTAKNIMRQLLITLKAIHEKGIAHKDIKLENILYNTNTKKATFIDFGLSSFSVGKPSEDFCGSKEYCSPEVRNKISFLPEKADIWSLGITGYALLFGMFPFSPRDLEAAMHPQAFYPTGKVSEDAIDFLNRMIQIQPSKRASLNELAQHPWLAKKKSFFSSKKIGF